MIKNIKKEFLITLFIISSLLIFSTVGLSDISASLDSVFPGDPSNGIYQITLPSITITADQLYNKGYNGLYDQIDLSNGTEYKAYPINGVELEVNKGTNDTLTTFPTSTNFSASINTDGLLGTLYQYATDSSGNAILLSSQNITFPANPESSYPSTTGYTITLYDGSQTDCYNNSVDAVPFLVLIKKNGNPVPPTDPIYSHVAFIYTNPITSNFYPIGCNNFDSNTGGLAILPASQAEIYSDNNKFGYVRYGTNWYSQFAKYLNLCAFYYVYCGSLTTVEPTSFQAVLVGADGSYKSSISTSLTLNIVSDNSNLNELNPNFCSRANNIENINFPINMSNVFVGTNIYPDYVAYENNILFVPPVGVNDQKLDSRFDWSKIDPGFEINPATSTGDNPFISNNFSWSYLYTDDGSNSYYVPSLLYNGNVYDYFFSQYGTFTIYTMDNVLSNTKNNSTGDSDSRVSYPEDLSFTAGQNNVEIFNPPNNSLSSFLCSKNSNTSISFDDSKTQTI